MERRVWLSMRHGRYYWVDVIAQVEETMFSPFHLFLEQGSSNERWSSPRRCWSMHILMLRMYPAAFAHMDGFEVRNVEAELGREWNMV